MITTASTRGQPPSSSRSRPSTPGPAVEEQTAVRRPRPGSRIARRRGSARRGRSPRRSDARPYTAAPVARKTRVVIAKVGLDGHDRGAKMIARALRDAGMEVIYTGLHQTPEQIVETVIQEDADAVGVSILSGAHMTLVPRILDAAARERRSTTCSSLVGGTIPDGRRGGAEGAGRGGDLHARRADRRDRRLPAREGSPA